MKKFVYLYFVNQEIPDNEANTKLWGEWFAMLADNLLDEGSSFKSSSQAQVSEGKVTKDPDEIAGFTIVQAESLNQAVEWVKDGPLARMRNLHVRVYEAH